MVSDGPAIVIDHILSKYSLTEADSEAITNIANELCHIPEVVAIYLYGSYVRNEAKPYSEIDIAVVTNSSSPERKIRELIGSYSSKKIDVQVLSDLPLTARMQVFQQGVPLYIRSKDTLWNIIKSVNLSYMDLEPMRNRWKKRVLGV